MSSTTVVIGAGELGTRFALAWLERHPHSPLVCTVRHPERRERRDLPGAEIVAIDLLHPEGLDAVLSGARSVLVSVAPGREGDDTVWSEGVGSVVQRLEADAHVVHISSTGVYAAVDGRTVDEGAELADTPRARALVAAEAAVRAHPRSTVLRCSGLVAPGRGPQNFVDRLAGQTRPGADGWLNLVWMDDVVEVTARALELRIAGTFNLSGPPQRRRDFFDPLVEAAGLPPIRWTDGNDDAGKRIDCNALRTAFGMEPRPVHPADLAP